MVFENNISPVIAEIGPLEIRWYGVFFAVGLFLAYLVIRYAFQKKGFKLRDLDSLAVYLFLGLVIGARIGHVLFYNFEYFLENPWWIFQIWTGGLASHGAAIGVLIAYLVWIYVHKVKFVKYADELVLGMPLVAMFVRIGNFFNSEIVGLPVGGGGAGVVGSGAGGGDADAVFGVIFRKLNEDFVRHPVQLYEALLCLVIFVVMFVLFVKRGSRMPRLFFLFFFMLTYFVGRFLLEYYKDLHTLPADFPLSMGQVLSMGFIIAALVYFVLLLVKKVKKIL